VCIDLGEPRPAQQNGGTVCGVYVIPVTVRTCGAAAQVAWTANLTAHYSRNWLAWSAAGATPDFGVWRFLLNGDVIPSAFAIQRYGNNRCVVPACFATYHAIYVQGYVDYAFDCVNRRWLASGAFDHGCDLYAHGQSTSVRPGPAAGFDPGRSYTWVFPAANFSPFAGSATDPVGNGSALSQEAAFRLDQWTTAPDICNCEELALVANVGSGSGLCECPASATGAPQFVETFVSAAGECNSTLNTGQFPLPFVQKRIGRWTNAATYPGGQYLLLEMGYLAYGDACEGTLAPQYMEGVETIGGFRAITYDGIPLDRQFDDWGSSNPRPAAGTPPHPNPIVGAPHITWYLTHMNLL
jgi:hypothetical protein